MDGEIIPEDELGATAAVRLYPLLIGQVFALIFTGAVLIVLARLLGPAGYGLYSFAFGFQAFVDGVGAWGIGAYFGKELSTHAYRKDFERILGSLMAGFTIIIPVAVGLTLIGIFFSGYVANVWFTNIGISAFSLELVSLISFFVVVQVSANWALTGLKKSGLNAISTVTTDIVQLGLIIILVPAAYGLGYGLNGAIVAMVIGYAVGAILSLYFLYITVSKYGKFRLIMPVKKDVKLAWSFSLPVAANNFLNNGMQNFGILFLGLYVTATTLGNYGAALKGLALLALVYNTFGTVLLPTFSDVRSMRKSEQINKTYNKVIIYALVLVFPLLIYIAAFATPGLFVIVSGSYMTASLFLALIAVGTLLNLFGSYVSYLLMSKGYTKEVLIYNLYSTIVELISLVVLVDILPGDTFKVIGAIFASFFLGNIVASVLFVRGATRLLQIKFEYNKIARLVVATAVLGAVLVCWYLAGEYLLSGISNMLIVNLVQLLVGAVLALLIYPILVAILKVIDREDLKSIKIAVNKYGTLKSLLSALTNYVSPFLEKST